MSSVSIEPLASIVDKRWVFVSNNTAILAFMLCGVVSTLIEVAGYWPVMETSHLLQPETSQQVNPEELYPELKNITFKFLEMVHVARMYTTHIYLATYILLPYPLITERQKVLLTPWLICSILRSLLMHLLMTLAGITLCAAQHSFYYPCLQFSALRGVEFCISLYMWTNVHNFYHFLDDKSSVEDIEMVIKTFQRAGINTYTTERHSLDSLAWISLNNEELDDLGIETTILERAAMAWIAREILESGEDYESDAQFSQYLAAKATEELRQILKEIAQIKREERRMLNELSVKEKINDSLEIYKQVRNHEDTEIPLQKIEAFYQSENLSRRDPIRKIPPLSSFENESFTDKSINYDPNIFNYQVSPALNSKKSTPGEKSVEVQTDPLSPEMIQLFDALEKQYEKQKYRKKSKSRAISKHQNYTVH